MIIELHRRKWLLLAATSLILLSGCSGATSDSSAPDATRQLSSPIAATLKPLDQWLEDEVILGSDATFDPGSYQLTEDGEALLLKLLPNLASTSRDIRIDGYTDGSGDISDAYNQELSKNRARAVADWLTSVGNIDPARIKEEDIQGYGMTGEINGITAQPGVADSNRRAVRISLI